MLETISHNNESTDLGTSAMSVTMRTWTSRWALATLPTGFAGLRYPKVSNYPHDHQKYDGFQESESWLGDYLQAVKILGGTKATTMQSLQLQLSRAVISWLRKVPDESIGSSDDLKDQFVCNFRSTYK
jgi:hypothetical protein